MVSNLKKHEIIGLLMIFLSGTLIGFGLYLTFWGANRPLFFGRLDQLISGREFLLFPMFYGLGLVLFELGKIELKEAMPGKNRK
ncbi:MAG: hypothetical protein ABIJ34_08645 [archaeon]